MSRQVWTCFSLVDKQSGSRVKNQSYIAKFRSMRFLSIRRWRCMTIFPCRNFVYERRLTLSSEILGYEKSKFDPVVIQIAISIFRLYWEIKHLHSIGLNSAPHRMFRQIEYRWRCVFVR